MKIKRFWFVYSEPPSKIAVNPFKFEKLPGVILSNFKNLQHDEQ